MGWLDIISGVGSAAAGYDIADDIRGVGADAAAQMGTLAGQLQQDAAFKGYGVTTGMGTSSVAPDGSLNVGVGPDAGMQAASAGLMSGAQTGYGNAMQAAMGATSNPAYQTAMGAMQGGMAGLGGQQANSFAASQQAMGNAMMDPATREQEIYNRAMAMQNPQLDAAQASQQAREYAMGRGGIRGSQFGGTAEDAAMARARAQASNQASFQAMNQAQQEMMNQGQLASQFGQLGGAAAGLQGTLGQSMGALGQGQAQLGQTGGNIMAQIAQGQGALGNQMYGNSWMPYAQQLQALQAAQGTGSMAQTGQLTGTNLGAQLGLGGIQTQVNAEKAASELYGTLFGAGMQAMGAASGTLGDKDGNWFEQILSYL